MASGNSSTMLHVIIIPATKANTFSRLIQPVLLNPLKNSRLKKAPSGSARPLMLAKAKLIHGESGRAARHGIATAIPSGMLWMAMPMVTVMPNLSVSNAAADTASPSGKLCAASDTKSSIATLHARLASLSARSSPLAQDCQLSCGTSFRFDGRACGAAPSLTTIRRTNALRSRYFCPPLVLILLSKPPPYKSMVLSSDSIVPAVFLVAPSSFSPVVSFALSVLPPTFSSNRSISPGSS
mmetsp:Transcript_12522/g.35819  ORF Transcript_12522/g.35819 Transcript_12522/m.35819 type:complete len:239 (-) Transcript_12522:530-1246(-)